MCIRHKGIQGNGKNDEVAKEESELPFAGSEPVFGISSTSSEQVDNP